MANLGNNRISATIDATDMAVILANIKDIEGRLSFLLGLTPDERQALPKLSWDNKQFVDDCMTYIKSNPEYLPAYQRCESS